MTKYIRIIAVILAIAVIASALTACTEAEKVSYNLSKEADKLNVIRKITVINVRSNDVLYEIIAKCSIQNEGHNELAIISEVSEGIYKKDFVYLSEWVTYIVEDVTGSYTDPYHYEIRILPYLRGIAGNFTIDDE